MCWAVGTRNAHGSLGLTKRNHVTAKILDYKQSLPYEENKGMHFGEKKNVIASQSEVLILSKNVNNKGRNSQIKELVSITDSCI